MTAVRATTAAPDPRRWQALALVCTAFFMTVLDVSIVNVALPSIGRSLHFSETGLQWVVTAYAITYGGFLLLGGRAGDILGRKRMFSSAWCSSRSPRSSAGWPARRASSSP